MSQLFDKIKVGNAKRSTFDLSHNQVTSSDFGYLIPICYRDMLPNDDFVVKPNLFTRLTTMPVPTYGRIVTRIHHFFVPYRILYPKWDAFISQSPSNFTTPPFFINTAAEEFFNLDPAYKADYSGQNKRGIYTRLLSNLGLNPSLIMGMPIGERYAAFPLLAYRRIWLDWFMDSNINDHASYVEEFNAMIEDGGDLSEYLGELLKTKNVCYKKDYFTTAKQRPQEGDPSIVGVDIASSELNPGIFSNLGSTALRRSNAGEVYVADTSSSPVPPASNSKIGQFTVEDLRAATAFQRYSERNNYVGSKLINRLLAHFGIAPTPERLDMAEFIGGDSFDIQIGDVTSTSFEQGAGAYYGLGAQAGKGVGGRKCKGVRYHAKEHGIFMTVMSILPDTAYYQGISRFWSKGVTGDALDYYTPEYENLGFQEILNKEVYVPSTAEQVGLYQNYDPDGVFGYQVRYGEYKYHSDILAGDFVGVKSPELTTHFNMDSWHLFRKMNFTENSPLALNNNFVELNNHANDYDRIFQYTDNSFDHFYFNIFCDVKATRSMVGFAEPSVDSVMNQGDGQTVTLPYGGTRL